MSDDRMWQPPSAGGAPPPPPPPVAAPPASAAPSPPSPPTWGSSTSPASPGAPAGPPAAPVLGQVAPPSSFPDIGVEPPPVKRRGKGVLVGAVAAVVAVGAAGTFAAVQVTGGGGGGADSAEAVGTEFLAALENEDVIGLLDLLLPGERETLKQPAIDIVDELSRLEVLDPDASLAEIGGLDIVIDDEFVRTTATNADDIVNLVVSGEASGTVDGEQLAIGDLLLDRDVDPSALDADLPPEAFEIPLTAVERGGRWYLSVFYLAAEQARADLDPMPDIPTEGVAPSGGDSPEAAVDALLRAVEDLDVARAIGALNPNEAEALQRYAPLFVEDLQDQIDSEPFDWRIDDVAYEVRGSGGDRAVDITKLVIAGESDGRQFRVTFDGGCVVLDVDGKTLDSCTIADEQVSDLGEIFSDPQPFEDVAQAVEDGFADYDAPGMISVDEVDGMWYVSPIGTGFDQLLALMRALDRPELERIIDTGEAAVDAFFDQLFGGLGDDFDDPANECWGVSDTEAAVTCFLDAIAQGADPLGVPSELRFPECGLADLYWTGGYVELSDADFTAVMTSASACFEQLVAAGTISAEEVPLEATDVACLEGRNLYNAYDDQEYIDRAYDCLFAD